MNVAEAAEALQRAGVPSARHDADQLACHLLGVRTHELPRTDLGPDYDALIARRSRREPLQYVVGSAPFRRLEVLVGPGAFIPRPETEELAGFVIDAVKDLSAPVVVDLCSGPGTIALSIAQEVPHARVYAVEVDETAAMWAKRNIEASGLSVTLTVADVCDDLPELNGTADAVVANPPYIVAGTVEQPEVRDHEPAVALYDEADGLAVTRIVVARAMELLRDGGLLAIEHGDDQGASVPAILRDHGFVDVHDHRDLAGRDRFASGRKP